MEASRRLTPLAVMVLALLREGDMHPYEMMRLFRARRDERLVPLSNGTLYHTVGRLHEAGLLEEVGVDREGNRPERTTYTLTDAGHTEVLEWVRRELPRTDRPDRFRVALAEAHNLERSEAVALLRRRRDSLAEMLQDLTAALATAREGGVDEQYILEANWQAALIAADIAWFDARTARLLDPGEPWGPEPVHTTISAAGKAPRP